MDILFGTTDKRRNSTKDVPLSKTYTCRLKEATDICNPIILIHDEENITTYNYAYMPEFARYYYVVSWVSVRDKLWEATLQVDVMLSYKAQILAADAFVMYSQNRYNTMLPDHRLPRTYQSDTVLFQKKEWDVYDVVGCYVLSIGGDSAASMHGMAQTVVLTQAQMGMLANKLMNKTMLEEFKEFFTDPFNLVVGCRWLPVNAGAIAGFTSGTIKLADFDTGIPAQVAKLVITGSIKFDIQLPHKSLQPDGSYTYADYRNCEPYAQYMVSLPGYGMWEIPMTAWIGYGGSEPRVYIDWSLSPVSGDINYAIAWGDHHATYVQGNVGSDAPVINSTSGIGGAITPALKSLVNSGIGMIWAVAGAPEMALFSGLSATMNAIEGGATALQRSYNTAGNMGGKDGLNYNHDFRVLMRPYEVSDTPSNVAKTMGRPCYKQMKVNQLSGYAKLLGCYPEVQCTQTEYDMLIQLLNSGANYQYGGVFIE